LGKMPGERDTLYEAEIGEVGDFVFDDRVVRVFPDMINRSGPGYSTVVAMTAMLARRYAIPGTVLYDLGCSLGAVSRAMSLAVQAPDCRIIAVDNAPGMITRLAERLAAEPDKERIPVTAVVQDIRETPIDNASVVVLNFTLQFVEPKERAALIRRIALGMVKGGVLVLSEKIAFADDEEQSLQTAWHHDFKRSQGYSELAIARKRDALENVLIPDTADTHTQRLNDAGFEPVYRWFQGFSFVSWVAFRADVA
jgi:tRNA (cmo5U34)-methyltransferase